MKITIVVLILSAALAVSFTGCSSTPQRPDDSKIKHHADEGFKELQKEENKY